MHQRQLRPSPSQGVGKLAVSTPWRQFCGRMAKFLAPLAANELARGHRVQTPIRQTVIYALMCLMLTTD